MRYIYISRSGTEGEYAEKEQLLQDLSDLRDNRLTLVDGMYDCLNRITLQFTDSLEKKIISEYYTE